MDRLPADILRLIAIVGLSGADVGRLSSSARCLRHALFDSESLWETLYRRDLTDAKDAEGRYLRSAQNYGRAYREAFFSLPKGSYERNKFAASLGYERLLRTPLDEGSVGKRAAAAGHVDILALALPSGQTSYPSIVLGAAENGRSTAVDFLLAKAPERRHIALFGAAKGGHDGLVARLSRSREDREHVLYGMVGGDYLERMIAMMDETTWDEEHALHRAAQHGAERCFRYLVERFEPNELALDGALRLATFAGHLPIVRYLHEERIREITAPTLLEAADGGSVPVFEYLLSRCRTGLPPRALFRAVQHGRSRMVRFLLDMGMPITAEVLEAAAVQRLGFIADLATQLSPDSAAELYRLLPESILLSLFSCRSGT